MADLVLGKLSLSENNTGAGKVMDYEKVDTEPRTLTVKKMDSEKVKAGSETCPEKVVDSEKVKVIPGMLTGVEAAEVRRIVVDLARVEPEIEVAGPGEPTDMEARKKSEAKAVAKCEKHGRKRHLRRKQG